MPTNAQVNALDTIENTRIKANRRKLRLSLISACVLTALGTGSVQAQFGDGFKSFAQDSCDPLLSGVLTEDGYKQADLGDLYQEAYNEDVRSGCGFTRVGEVSTFVPPETFPVALEPVVTPDPFDNIVVPEPIDLPDLDLSDEDTGSNSVFSGLYGRLYGAYAKPSTSAGTSSLPAPSATFTDSVDTGFGGSAALGYAFNFDGLGVFNNLRPEIQASYYKFDGSAFTGTNGFAASSSDETLIGGFANLVTDIEFGLLPITPYLGLGLGYGQRTVDYGSNSFKDTGLLYQAMVGGRYNITERLSLDLGYKYLRSFDIDSANGSTSGTFSVDGRNHHMVEGGLTFRF
ncbi:MAG: outer membrane protein [Alphaproteobacteria bacterium]